MVGIQSVKLLQLGQSVVIKVESIVSSGAQSMNQRLVVTETECIFAHIIHVIQKSESLGS